MWTHNLIQENPYEGRLDLQEVATLRLAAHGQHHRGLGIHADLGHTSQPQSANARMLSIRVTAVSLPSAFSKRPLFLPVHRNRPIPPRGCVPVTVAPKAH